MKFYWLCLLSWHLQTQHILLYSEFLCQFYVFLHLVNHFGYNAEVAYHIGINGLFLNLFLHCISSNFFVFFLLI